MSCSNFSDAGDGRVRVVFDHARRRLERDGEISIAAILPLSRRDANGSCSAIFNPYVMIFLEPLLFTLRRHGFSLSADATVGNTTVQRRVSVGFRVSDQCAYGRQPLTDSLKFILGFSSVVDSPNDSVLSLSQCEFPLEAEEDDGAEERQGEEEGNEEEFVQPEAQRIMGLIGPLAMDDTVEATAPITSARHLVQIATRSSRDSFSCVLAESVEQCSWEHEYLFRAGSSDRYQAYAIADIIKHYGWSHIAIVASEDLTNSLLRATLMERIQAYGMCVAFQAQLTTKADAFVIGRLLRLHERAKVVVVLASKAAVEMLFETIALGKPIPRVWIGTDQWASAIELGLRLGGEYLKTMQAVIKVDHKIPSQFSGWTWAKSQQSHIQDFADFILHITAGDLRRDPLLTSNPLLCQLMEEYNNCSGVCAENVTDPTKTPCSDSEQLPTTLYVGAHITLPEVVEVFTMFSGEILLVSLQDLFQQTVARNPSMSGSELVSTFYEESFGSNLKTAVKNIQLQCGNASCFVFPENLTELLPSYHITAVNLAIHKAPWVGSWNVLGDIENAITGELVIDDSLVTFGKNLFPDDFRFEDSFNQSYVMGDQMFPVSSCSDPCKPGFGRAAGPVASPGCCHVCTQCSDAQFSPGGMEGRCLACPDGMRQNQTRSGCVELPEEHLGVVTMAVVSLCVALMIVVNLFSMGLYVYHRRTKLVRSSDIALSLTALIAIECGLVTILLHLFLVELVGCDSTRLLTLSSLLLTASIILVKTGRLARIHFLSKNLSKRVHRWTMTSFAQGIFIASIASFGIGTEAILMIIRPSKLKREYTSTVTYKVCSTPSIRTISSDVYLLSAVLLTACLAFFTRKLPVNFNEAQLLFLASFSLSAIWIALRPVYYLPASVATDHSKERLDVVLVLTSFVVLWVWLFAPRLYALICRPHRRNRTVRVPGSSTTIDTTFVTRKSASKSSQASILTLRPFGEKEVGTLLTTCK